LFYLLPITYVQQLTVVFKIKKNPLILHHWVVNSCFLLQSRTLQNIRIYVEDFDSHNRNIYIVVPVCIKFYTAYILLGKSSSIKNLIRGLNFDENF
jgi:hypothetical protein